ncbi:hypothetical protein J4Q44_G00123860 [Coregonus suidteri]|uniref:Uncharacterized protein n=1 Tax=Coregonus suidteri TaxID=861788 RepID=A0AAN8QYM4_9TELE
MNCIQLRWQQLLAACLNAPYVAMPHLLQQILVDMEHLMPLDTRQKLLRLSSIYTQGADSGHPSCIYTLKILHESLRLQSRHQVHTKRPGTVSDPCKAQPERTEDVQEYLSPDALSEKAAELRGSPWQVCTDKLQWKNPRESPRPV